MPEGIQLTLNFSPLQSHDA